MAFSKAPHSAPSKFSPKKESNSLPITNDSDMGEKANREFIAKMTPEEKDQLLLQLIPLMSWVLADGKSIWYKPLLFTDQDRIACADVSAILFQRIFSGTFEDNAFGVSPRRRANNSMMSFVSKRACLDRLDQLQRDLEHNKDLKITLQGLCNIFATALKMASVKDATKIDDLFVDDPNFNIRARLEEIADYFASIYKVKEQEDKNLDSGRRGRVAATKYLHPLFKQMQEEFEKIQPSAKKGKGDFYDKYFKIATDPQDKYASQRPPWAKKLTQPTFAAHFRNWRNAQK